MEKIFAVVWSSSYPTPGVAAIIDTFTDIYHYFKYPSFNGYSLSEAEFYDKLEDAENRLARSRYGGIIALEVENDEVVNIMSVYRNESITVSAAALQAMTDMLKVRYVKPHLVDAASAHPEAKLCRQLSARFNEVNGQPQDMKVTVAEFSAMMASGISFCASAFVGLAALTCPQEQCPITAASAVAATVTRIAASATIATPFLVLGTVLAMAGTYRIRNAENKEERKREYIRNNLFSYRELRQLDERERVGVRMNPGQ